MEIAKGVQPPALAAVIAVQIGGDLLTLGTLWYLAFSRRDSAQSPIGRLNIDP